MNSKSVVSNMKNLTKIFAVLTTSVLMLSSWIEETFPEGGSATAEQVGSSAEVSLLRDGVELPYDSIGATDDE